MATKKAVESVEHFEVTYNDHAGDRRVQLAHSQDEAVEAAGAFVLGGMENVEVHKVHTSHTPVSFKAPKLAQNDEK